MIMSSRDTAKNRELITRWEATKKKLCENLCKTCKYHRSLNFNQFQMIISSSPIYTNTGHLMSPDQRDSSQKKTAGTAV